MGKKKILIVDDEKDALTMLESRLIAAGYSVIKADNGEDAVRLAKSEQPDLVLLDVIMPDMDGTEIGKILKNDSDTKDIPLVFLTCLFTKTDEAVKGHKVSGNFFIAKPYRAEELLKEIKKQLSTEQ